MLCAYPGLILDTSWTHHGHGNIHSFCQELVSNIQEAEQSFKFFFINSWPGCFCHFVFCLLCRLLLLPHCFAQFTLNFCFINDVCSCLIYELNKLFLWFSVLFLYTLEIFIFCIANKFCDVYNYFGRNSIHCHV